MKKFQTKNNPYLTTKKDTKQIMLNILISLIPIIGYAVYLNGFNILINLVIAMAVSSLIEGIYVLITKGNIANHYIYLQGLLIGLMLPISASITTVIIASSIATILKIIMSKLNFHLLNTTILTIIITSFFTKLTGASIITTSVNNYAWIFLALGFLYLLFTQTTKWYITLSYLLTIYIMIYFVGLYCNYAVLSSCVYSVTEILRGSIIFIAIYIATDTFTSPTTVGGSIIYGILLGIVTTILLYFIAPTNAVYYAVLGINILSPLVDRIGVAGRLDHSKVFIAIGIVWLILAISTVAISFHLKQERIIESSIIKEQV